MTTVTISKSEHDYLLRALREFNLLKSALFRGGLTADTLETLLQDEESAPSEACTWEDNLAQPQPARFSMNAASSPSDSTTNGDHLQLQRSVSDDRFNGYAQLDALVTSPDQDDDSVETSQRIPLHDQRTVLITNLSDRTTHKDLIGIIRGGRLLDVFLRNDKTATVSFVEGAADFLAYAKRNDIYLHQKRLEFKWNDRQFRVPPHVSNKILSGASRNLIVRGAAGKLTADQIRDHLDHIHNLVVVDIFFKNGDAFISTNSIHNALFARTCCLSRSVYKGLRIDWCPDECAAPLPRTVKPYAAAPAVYTKSPPIANRYTLLDTGSVAESDSDDSSYMTSGVSIRQQWADTAVV